MFICIPLVLLHGGSWCSGFLSSTFRLRLIVNENVKSYPTGETVVGPLWGGALPASAAVLCFF